MLVLKVGILTYHDGFNFGAYLQVYALQRFLQENGFQCKVINYKKIGFTFREYKYALSIRRPYLLLRTVVKIAKFKVAHRRLNLTDRMFSNKELVSLCFDGIIIGSDEVWNFGSKLIGYDPVYFSAGLKSERIISYAASFGNIQNHENISEEIRENLRQINYVSVRDINSSNIMNEIINAPVTIVLDPTFLFDLKPEAIKPNEENYILIYGNFTKKMIKRIKEYALYVRKKTISVGYYLPWCDSSVIAINPFQWLGYFVNCDCIITTMYHGMIFAVLNHKEFCMVRTPYRVNKVGDLLEDLGLSKRWVEEDESIRDRFAETINYNKVDMKIEIKRHQSKDFLLRALK